MGPSDGIHLGFLVSTVNAGNRSCKGNLPWKELVVSFNRLQQRSVWIRLVKGLVSNRTRPYDHYWVRYTRILLDTLFWENRIDQSDS